MNAGSSSAVAKCVIAPASRSAARPRRLGDARRLGGVARPEPPHPGVELDVHARTGAARGERGDELLAPGDDVGARAAARRPAPRADSAPITSSGPSMPAARSSAASPAVATASHVAPPRCAARAAGTAPWP